MLVITGSAVGTIDRMLGAGRPPRQANRDSPNGPVAPLRARVFLPRVDPNSFIEHVRLWRLSVAPTAVA
jgi:hypothetical protein